MAEAFLLLAEAFWVSSRNVHGIRLNRWGLRSIAGPTRRLRLAALQNIYTNVPMLLAYVCTGLRYSCIGVPTLVFLSTPFHQLFGVLCIVTPFPLFAT